YAWLPIVYNCVKKLSNYPLTVLLSERYTGYSPRPGQPQAVAYPAHGNMFISILKLESFERHDVS
ncbi:MAG: hypothetical protein K2P41_15335, partial [Lachnospiraceae bacterium]|nr:hypothetical protein [Lachnospiraceae bacterium]